MTVSKIPKLVEPVREKCIYLQDILESLIPKVIATLYEKICDIRNY